MMAAGTPSNSTRVAPIDFETELPPPVSCRPTGLVGPMLTPYSVTISPGDTAPATLLAAFTTAFNCTAGIGPACWVIAIPPGPGCPVVGPAAWGPVLAWPLKPKPPLAAPERREEVVIQF